MSGNYIKTAYSKLYSVSKGKDKTSLYTLDEYLSASGKKPRIYKKSEKNVDIVICKEDIPDVNLLRLGRSFPSALICSGANIPVSLIDKVKKQKTFSVIGLQKYLFFPQMETALNSCGFETLNLGPLRDDMPVCEPLLRNVKYVFLDMTSVKHSDYPWDGNENPNGFFANEICQIARYIGFSCDLKAVFIYGVPENGCPNVCSNLVAQVAWHIADAVANNIYENPQAEKQKGKLPDHFEHKIVDFCSHGDTLTFIMSAATGRWWMEVPVIKKNTTELVACTANDYQTACDGQVPMRWLYYYNRLNAM